MNTIIKEQRGAINIDDGNVEIIVTDCSDGHCSMFADCYMTSDDNKIPVGILKGVLDGQYKKKTKTDKYYVIESPTFFGERCHGTYNTFIWIVKKDKKLACKILDSIRQDGHGKMWKKYKKNRVGHFWKGLPTEKITCQQKVGSNIGNPQCTEIIIKKVYELEVKNE